MDAPSRCILQSLDTRPGTEVVGYGPDDRIEVPADGMFVIGRSRYGGVSIRADIGGIKTFGIVYHDAQWLLCVNNEWARARLNGVTMTFDRQRRRVLCDRDEVEVLQNILLTSDVVHRFRVELTRDKET